jgi:flotillin
MRNLFLAAGEGLDFWSLIWVAGALTVFSLFIMVLKRYRRCPSNRVLVKYGKVGGEVSARCIHGGATFVMPIFQDYAYLSLEPLQIEIPLKGALSAENIRVNVPSVFTVAIGTDPAVMQNAAIRLLGLDYRAIQQQAQEIIFGQLRQVIASMRIEEINRDRETFLQHIQTSLEPELRKVGLVLINVNITDITDESGYIEAIGQKSAAQAIQQARGDVADQEKLGETHVAEANRDKAVQVANAEKTKQIGTREAMRDQAVRIAELDKDQKIAEQSAGFEREAKVKDAERAMRIALAEANAKAVEGENKSQAFVVASQAELAIKQAEAYRMSEIKKREAEAAVQEAQNRAMAKAALAQAERIEAERRAAVEAPAKAEKAKTIVEAEADAERRRIEASGEAQAIYAKLEAEARGNFQILAKKGEGLRQIVEACGGSQQAFQMLMLEHLDHIAETSAQAISNIKFDKVVVWEGGAGGKENSGGAAGFLQSMARTIPPMMQVVKDIGGCELPSFLGKPEAETAKPEGNGGAEPAAAADATTSGRPHAPEKK